MHKKVVTSELIIIVKVPRPGDSGVQPAKACSEGGAVGEHPTQVLVLMAAKTSN